MYDFSASSPEPTPRRRDFQPPSARVSFSDPFRRSTSPRAMRLYAAARTSFSSASSKRFMTRRSSKGTCWYRTPSRSIAAVASAWKSNARRRRSSSSSSSSSSSRSDAAVSRLVAEIPDTRSSRTSRATRFAVVSSVVVSSVRGLRGRLSFGAFFFSAAAPSVSAARASFATRRARAKRSDSSATHRWSLRISASSVAGCRRCRSWLSSRLACAQMKPQTAARARSPCSPYSRASSAACSARQSPSDTDSATCSAHRRERRSRSRKLDAASTRSANKLSAGSPLFRCPFSSAGSPRRANAGGLSYRNARQHSTAGAVTKGSSNASVSDGEEASAHGPRMSARK